ncbi:unnamed protein product [Oikopleura dioica]|uniref:Uncharacterized protein n=1 Tax=Oikopleura dioica TaxID=34765 RepID=E4XQB4_OIKDI|nr:unnamed protein product [Oikopleura dioica]
MIFSFPNNKNLLYFVYYLPVLSYFLENEIANVVFADMKVKKISGEIQLKIYENLIDMTNQEKKRFIFEEYIEKENVVITAVTKITNQTRSRRQSDDLLRESEVYLIKFTYKEEIQSNDDQACNTKIATRKIFKDTANVIDSTLKTTCELIEQKAINQVKQILTDILDFNNDAMMDNLKLSKEAYVALNRFQVKFEKTDSDLMTFGFDLKDHSDLLKSLTKTSQNAAEDKTNFEMKYLVSQQNQDENIEKLKTEMQNVREEYQIKNSVTDINIIPIFEEQLREGLYYVSVFLFLFVLLIKYFGPYRTDS